MTQEENAKNSKPQEMTHLNVQGEAWMVDVSDKAVTKRGAIAQGEIRMSSQSLETIEAGNAPKGDVLATARLAGIMAAKQTAQLIPLCHALPLQNVKVELIPDRALPGYQIRAEVVTTAQTGVEMEALTAVSVSALTLYDMAKALEKTMVIQSIRVVKKTGGKSSVINEESAIADQ